MKKRRWLFLAVVVCCLMFAVTDAMARAGGGGGYAGGGGGGGFSGSSGSGGSGGDGIAIYLLIRWWITFCVRYPIVGIPVTIAALFLFWKFGGKIKIQQQGRTIARGRQVQERSEREAAVSQLRQRDPAFDENTLYERIKQAFKIVQDAWSRQDLSTARAFISDGIIERFTLQLNEQKAKGIRNQMDQVAVRQVSIAQVESDTVFDSVTVRIDASAVDTTVDIKSGKRIAGSGAAESFTEYWTFVRRPGAKSLSGNGLIEGNCPNCGTALNINETAKCDSCGAIIRSGEYDWILTEITQACEWVAVSSKAIPGVAALQQADPGFSLRNLEDRASVIFWRYMTALREGRPEPVRKMALERFTSDLVEKMKPDEKGLVHYYEDCAVGAVETEGLLHGDDYDRAVVAVRWSGSGHSRKQNGSERTDSEPHVMYDLFVLARKHGVKADIRLALSSAHCPSCGAALHDEAADACEYCGAVLNDGSSGWVLEKILKVYSKEATALRESIRTGDPVQQQKRTRSSLEQAGWMIQVMLADGQVDPGEHQVLMDFAGKHNIPSAKIDEMITAMKAGKLEVPAPQTNDEASEWLHAMAEMVLADGKITSVERQAMLNMAKRLNFSSADINNILQSKRAELYRRGKESIRSSKSANG